MVIKPPDRDRDRTDERVFLVHLAQTDPYVVNRRVNNSERSASECAAIERKRWESDGSINSQASPVRDLALSSSRVDLRFVTRGCRAREVYNLSWRPTP